MTRIARSDGLISRLAVCCICRVQCPGFLERPVKWVLGICHPQVTEAKSTKEVLGLLAPRGTGQRPLSFDIVLKEHEPPRSNACRLLREFIQNDGLKSTPVVGKTCRL